MGMIIPMAVSEGLGVARRWGVFVIGPALGPGHDSRAVKVWPAEGGLSADKMRQRFQGRSLARNRLREADALPAAVVE